VTEEAPVEEPAAETVEEAPAKAEETVTFEGEVEVKLVNDEVYFGDEVTLKAVVSSSNGAAYSLQWQMDNGNGWEDISGETGSEYRFTVDEQNAEYSYRVVVVG